MKMILRIENDYCWLLTEDKDLRVKLWKALRFKQKNYHFNAAYKMKIWDGYENFFDKDSGRFLTGLLPEVTAALKYWNVTYTVKDVRVPFQFATQSVDEQWLPGITLRDYQVDYINQSIKLKRGLICSQTGTGKTLIMVGILKALPPNTKCLILCNKTSLVEQNYNEIKKYGLTNVGRVHGEVKEPDHDILCVTWQSIKNIKDKLKSIQCLIVDEIHEMMSPKVKIIYRVMKNTSIRIGLSATAFKFGGTDDVQKYLTKGFFGPPFLVKSAEDGKMTTKKHQERNILSTAKFVFFYVDTPKLIHAVYQDAVTQGIAENAHFHDMVSCLAQQLTGRTIIMVERIRQGDLLKARLPDAAWVSGKDNTKTRQYVIDRLCNEKGNVVAIATTGIFNTGINVFIHNLVNAAGGKADHAIIQRLGRGLRKSADKDVLRYFDFYFTMNHYLEQHSAKRVKILQKEGHHIEIRDKFDFNQVLIDE